MRLKSLGLIGFLFLSTPLVAGETYPLKLGDRTFRVRTDTWVVAPEIRPLSLSNEVLQNRRVPELKAFVTRETSPLKLEPQEHCRLLDKTLTESSKAKGGSSSRWIPRDSTHPALKAGACVSEQKSADGIVTQQLLLSREDPERRLREFNGITFVLSTAKSRQAGTQEIRNWLKENQLPTALFDSTEAGK